MQYLQSEFFNFDWISVSAWTRRHYKIKITNSEKNMIFTKAKIINNNNNNNKFL